MFESIALLGGFQFFAFVMLVVAFGIASSEFDSTIGGVITLTLLITGLHVFEILTFSDIVTAPLLMLFSVSLYIGIGFAYAIFYRYINFLDKNSDEIQRKWKEFQRENKDATREDFYKSYQYRAFTPSWNKDKIAAWITLWPWSVFWDLSHKPFRWIYKKLYALAGEMLDRVGKRVFNSIIDKADRK